MFPYMGSNFSCHVRRSSRGDSESSNNNWVYKIQFHARIASLHLTSPPYKEIISIPKSKQKKSSFKLQVGRHAAPRKAVINPEYFERIFIERPQSFQELLSALSGLNAPLKSSLDDYMRDIMGAQNFILACILSENF